MAVFWKNGYSATIMRDLADAMGINSSSLYNTDAETKTDFIINAFTGRQQSYIIHKDPIRIKKMARYLVGQISK